MASDGNARETPEEARSRILSEELIYDDGKPGSLEKLYESRSPRNQHPGLPPSCDPKDFVRLRFTDNRQRPAEQVLDVVTSLFPDVKIAMFFRRGINSYYIKPVNVTDRALFLNLQSMSMYGVVGLFDDPVNDTE